MSNISLNTNSLWDIGKVFEQTQSSSNQLADSLKRRVDSLNLLEDILQWSDERIALEVRRLRDQADRCGLAASYLFKMAENYENAERSILNSMAAISRVIADTSENNSQSIKETDADDSTKTTTDNKPVNDTSVTADTQTDYQKKNVKISDGETIVDSLNGVNAVYRIGSTSTGEYCCARYVSKYYEAIYGVKISNMFTGCTPAASRGTISVVKSPQVGDIGYQQNSSGKGHWFIVKSVNSDGTYTVIEQNWKFTYNGETYCTVNRRVSYESTTGLKFYRWSE